MSTIKFTKATANTLDKASRISPLLKICKDEDYISTANEGMIMYAPIDFTTPREVNIFNVKQMLNTIALIKDPVIDFSDPAHVLVRNESGDKHTKIRDTLPEHVMTYVEKSRLPDVNDYDLFSVTISPEDFDTIMKAARVTSAKHVGFVIRDDTITFSSFNRSEDGALSDIFSIDLCENETGQNFQLFYRLSQNDITVLQGEGDLTFRIQDDMLLSVVETETGKIFYIGFDTASEFDE